MARPSQRRSYLDSSLPSEWLEYSTGSRALPFVSIGPNVGSLYGAKSPTLIGAIFDKKSDFESKAQAAPSMFERFLNLQRNPEGLIEGKMRLPAGFSQAMALTSGFDS